MQYQNIIYGWFSVHHWEDGRSSVVSQTRAPLGGRGPWARPSGGQVAGGGRWRWQTAEDTRGWGAGGGRMEPQLLPAKRGRPRLRGSGRGRVDAGVDVHREKHREKLQSMVQYPKLQKYCGFQNRVCIELPNTFLTKYYSILQYHGYCLKTTKILPFQTGPNLS